MKTNRLGLQVSLQELRQVILFNHINYNLNKLQSIS